MAETEDLLKLRRIAAEMDLGTVKWNFSWAMDRLERRGDSALWCQVLDDRQRELTATRCSEKTKESN